MDRKTIDFISSILPKGRTVYYGFPDQYALLLLEHFVGEDGHVISELKKTHFSPLLKKPAVKRVLENLGGGRLTKWDLLTGWSHKLEAYRLTLGTWPDLDEKSNYNWDQLTRRGWNLVLQLNFSVTHNRELKETVPDWSDSIEDPNQYSNNK